MNKIYLDKLCEFTNTTYKNYYQNNKDKEVNIAEQIEIIKQNLSLNEKGIVNKYFYFELSSLIPDIEYDELVLVYPVCFNLKETIEWYNLLNSLLIILNDNYLYKTNIQKKLLMDTYDKTIKKKVNISEKLDDKILSKISSLINVNIIILSEKDKKIFSSTSTSTKYIVLFKHGIDYFPVMNWSIKNYNKNDYFIKYIVEYLEKANKQILNKAEEELIKEINETPIPKIKKVKSNITIVENKEVLEKKSSDNKLNNKKLHDEKPNEFYEEVITNDNSNENYALYISEAVDPKEIVSSTSKKIEEVAKKKSKKNSKDIFVVGIKESGTKHEKINEDKKLKPIEDSVFNPTDKLTYNDLLNIKENIKSTTTLPELQNYASKLSISITTSSSKTGKDKNKTKSELIDEIKKYIDDFKK